MAILGPHLSGSFAIVASSSPTKWPGSSTGMYSALSSKGMTKTVSASHRQNASTSASNLTRGITMVTLESPIEVLGPFDERLKRCLDIENIKTVGDLTSKSETELRRSPQFGHKSITVFKAVLAKVGLALKPCDWGSR